MGFAGQLPRESWSDRERFVERRCLQEKINAVITTAMNVLCKFTE